MRVIDVEYINDCMRDDLSFVFRCEEIFHDKIGKASVRILERRKDHPVVLITGPSGSGKTTTAMRLKDYLTNLDVPVRMLSMDNFFLPVDERPPEAEDWESPYCVDWNWLNEAVRTLKDGDEAEIPQYDFKTSSRKDPVKMQGDKDALIIVEGIHMLNPIIFDKLKDIATGVYVAPRTRVVTPGDRVLRPEQIRIARRMIRDYQSRGRSLKETVLMAKSVDAGEMQHITPYKENAIVHIDTFHDYELCILAEYIHEIPEAMETLDAQFIKEYRLEELIRTTNVLKPLRTAYIPKDSIVREFIGGSRYIY